MRGQVRDRPGSAIFHVRLMKVVRFPTSRWGKTSIGGRLLAQPHPDCAGARSRSGRRLTTDGQKIVRRRAYKITKEQTHK